MRAEVREVVYSPVSELRTPGMLLRSLWRGLTDSKELAWRLFVRDVSARYRQSALGILWAFAPALMASLVFMFLHSRRIVNFGETDVPYPVFVLVGVTLWQVFAESLNAPLNTVNKAKSMLAKVNFPREALVVSAFYDVIFNLLIKTVVLAGILPFLGANATWGLVFAPMAVLMIVLLGLAIGLLLTPIGMLYTDVASALTVGVQLWFFVTPVVYPPPTTFPYSLVTTLNPVSPLLLGARDLITKGVLPNWEAFVVASAAAVIALAAAWVVYRVSMPIIIERISA